MAPDIIVVHVAPGLAATGNVPVIDSAAITTPCGHSQCQNVLEGLRMALKGSWRYLHVTTLSRYVQTARDRGASRHGWAEDPEGPGPLASLPICDFLDPGSCGEPAYRGPGPTGKLPIGVRTLVRPSAPSRTHVRPRTSVRSVFVCALFVLPSFSLLTY